MSLPFLNTAPGYDDELCNSVFFERGLRAASVCGAVGAAVAVATIQGQEEAGIASAAGVAASMGAGLLEANRTGGTVKRVHCGWAARCGVAAADRGNPRPQAAARRRHRAVRLWPPVPRTHGRGTARRA